MFAHMKHAMAAWIFIAAPVFAEPAKPFDPWTPRGSKLISVTNGDLNRDGMNDAMLVFEETNPAHLKPNEALLGPDVLNLNPRRLVILLKTRSGYQKVLGRDGLLPAQNVEDMPCREDPLADGGISVSRGKLVIELNTWLSCGSYGTSSRKFAFRLEKARFRLIGYDHSTSSRSTGERSEYSINYITGMKKTTTGLNDIEASRPKVSWQRIPDRRKFHLEDMVFDCDAKDGVGCGWNQ